MQTLAPALHRAATLALHPGSLHHSHHRRHRLPCRRCCGPFPVAASLVLHYGHHCPRLPCRRCCGPFHVAASLALHHGHHCRPWLPCRRCRRPFPIAVLRRRRRLQRRGRWRKKKAAEKGDGGEKTKEVHTDCKAQGAGEGKKADPLKVLERVQKNNHRKVELLVALAPWPPSLSSPRRHPCPPPSTL